MAALGRAAKLRPVALPVLLTAILAGAPTARAQQLKVSASLSSLEEAVRRDSNDAAAYYNLALGYWSAARWDQAIVARRNAVNANPDDPSLILDLGKTLANAGKFQDAVEPLQQAAELNPRDARALFFVGAVLQQLGRKEEARTALTRFISLAPSRYERQIANAKQRLAALQ